MKAEGSRFTPLHVAASVEDGMDAINLLLQRDANTEATDESGQTPLHVAVQCESINNVVALLFEGNANITALDDSKLSPLHKAKTSKILDIPICINRGAKSAEIICHLIKNRNHSTACDVVFSTEHFCSFNKRGHCFHIRDE